MAAVDEKSEGPIKFTKSEAFRVSPQWSSMKTQGDEQPFYQFPVITISLISMMVWFFIYREENDLDGMLGASLFDHVEGLEKAQIEVCIIHYDRNGLDTTDLKARLAQILEEEEAAASKKAEEEAVAVTEVAALQ